jgi:hydrogenase-4 component B
MVQLAFNSFLTVLLLLPAAILLCRRSSRTRALPSLLFLLALLVGTFVAGMSFWRGDRLALDLSWLTLFPFAFAVDRLSAFFLLIICAVGAPVALFSIPYVERHYSGTKADWMWALLSLFLLSMSLVVTASTAFAFLFGWELMTLFSAGLIVIDGDSERRRHNIFIYLVMMHAGAAAVFASFLLFLPHAPGLDFVSIRAAAATMPAGLRTAVFLLFFVGFGTKAGIVPFHLWLPKAHPIAPSPVSALMSAVMLKTAIYGFVRFAFDFFGGGPAWWGYLIMLAGAVTGVLGILYALTEHDLKRLLAYSSVENIGIIYLGLGAALVFMANNSPAWAMVALVAALLHALNHSLFKSLLFLGAGAVSDATHTLDIELLGGLLKRMRVTGTVFLIGCCSIIGLPLFNGFVGEWLMFRSFIAGSELPGIASAAILPLMAGVLALIGAIAAACFAKLYGVAFLGRPRSIAAEHATEVATAMQAAMAVLAAACVTIGLMPGIVLSPLTAMAQELLHSSGLPEAEIPIAHTLPFIAACIAVLVIAVTGFRRIKRITPTWACGLPTLSSRMQYSSAAFSKPLRKVFARAYKPDRTVEVLYANEPYFPQSIVYRSVRTTSFEKSLYRPAVDAIVGMAARLRRLQTGNVQVYLLYIFLALIALLVFMRFV